MTTRFRGAVYSYDDNTTASAVVTFGSMTTEPGGAPISGAMMSPTSIDIIHHLSPHARTPREAQRSAYSTSASRVASGMAPSECETRYFVLLRMGKRSRYCRRGRSFHRVVVSIEFAGDARVKVDRFHGRVLRIGNAGQHFEHLVFPQIDRHRERDARLVSLFGFARLADAMRRRREDVVADALHVIAGVEDDAARRRGDAHPLHVAAIEDLQALDARSG